MTNSSASTEQLIDLAEGRLDEAQTQQVLAQIAHDPASRDAHAWVSNFVSVSQQATLQSPPASTRAMLEGLLPQRPRLTDELARMVSYVARLIRDVPAGHAFAGARSAAIDSKRELLFDVGDGADLMLQLEMTTDAVRISGQILAGDPAWRVLLVSEHATIETAADEFGEFAASVPATAFLRLDLVADSHQSSVDLTPYLDAAQGPSGQTTAPPQETSP